MTNKEMGMKKTLTSLLGTVVLASAVNANADGRLDITNNINGVLSNTRLIHSSNTSASDEFGYGDLPKSFDSGTVIYSNIGTNILQTDTRNNISDTPFVVKSFYNGTLDFPVTNVVSMGFFNANTFNHKTNMTLRVLDTNGVATTDVYDIKQIAATNGCVNLGIIPAGTYNLGTPVKAFQIDFEPLNPPAATNQPPVACNTSVSFPKSTRIGSGESYTTYVLANRGTGNITNVNFLNSIDGLSVNGTNITYVLKDYDQNQTFPGITNLPFQVVDDLGITSSVANLEFITTNRHPAIETKSYSCYKNGVNSNPGLLYNTSTIDPDGDPVSMNVLSTNNCAIQVKFDQNQSKFLKFYPLVSTPFNESIPYTLADNFGGVSTNTYNVNFTNRPPFVLGFTNNATYGQPAQITPIMGDPDELDTNLTFSVGTVAPSKGDLEGIVGNTGTYNAHNNEFGLDVFDVKAYDGESYSTNAPVVMNVSSETRAPYFTSIFRESPQNPGMHVNFKAQPNRVTEVLRKYDLNDTNDWQVMATFSNSLPTSTSDYGNFILFDNVSPNSTNPAAIYNLRTFPHPTE